MQINDVTEKIIGCAIEVHRQLGPGFLESVYQAALAFELEKSGLQVALVINFNTMKLIDGIKRVVNKYSPA
jgi:hypothetical protein